MTTEHHRCRRGVVALPEMRRGSKSDGVAEIDVDVRQELKSLTRAILRDA